MALWHWYPVSGNCLISVKELFTLSRLVSIYLQLQVILRQGKGKRFAYVKHRVFSWVDLLVHVHNLYLTTHFSSLLFDLPCSVLRHAPSYDLHRLPSLQHRLLQPSDFLVLRRRTKSREVGRAVQQDGVLLLRACTIIILVNSSPSNQPNVRFASEC